MRGIHFFNFESYSSPFLQGSQIFLSASKYEPSSQEIQLIPLKNGVSDGQYSFLLSFASAAVLEAVENGYFAFQFGAEKFETKE